MGYLLARLIPEQAKHKPNAPIRDTTNENLIFFYPFPAFAWWIFPCANFVAIDLSLIDLPLLLIVEG